MRKLSVLFVAAFLLSAPLFAQPAKEVRVKVKKADQPAAVAQYTLSKDLVTPVLLAELQKAGMNKPSKSSGYSVFKEVSWSEVSPHKIDVYYKVDGKKKKPATVTLLVAKGYDNFVSSSTDKETMDKMLAFLNRLVTELDRHVLQQNILTQTANIKLAEEGVNASVEAGKNLVKQRENVEKQIAENKTDQEKKRAALEQEKRKLETLKNQQQQSAQ